MAIRTKQIRKEPLPQQVQTSAPETSTGIGTFYTKSISGVAEGFYIDDQGREIQITEDGSVKAAGTGTVTTGANLGTGAGVFAQTAGTALQFKSIKAGPNVEVSSSSTEVTLSVAGLVSSASNSILGIGTGTIFKGATGSDLVFKKIRAGTNITITNGTDDITIASAGGVGSGETNTASNLGTTGEGIFAQKLGVDLQFKRIRSGSNVTLSSDANSITVATSAEANTASNSSSGTGAGNVFKSKVGSDLVFKKIKAGPNVVISDGADDVTISATLEGGDVPAEIQDVAFNFPGSGHVWLRIQGTPDDIASVTVEKATNSVTISSVPESAKLISATVRFDAADITAGTATIQYPEPNGQTSLITSSFPTVVRFTEAGAQQTVAFSVNNSSGTINLNCANLTSSARNYLRLVF